MVKNKINLFLPFFAAFVLSLLVIQVTHYSTPLNETSEIKVQPVDTLNQDSGERIVSFFDTQVGNNKRLQKEADALLYLFDNLPPVSVYIKNEPIIKSGTNVEKAVAYTICEGKSNPIIFIKNDFYRKVNRPQLVNILKHELTHAWFCRQNISAQHDARFRAKFQSIGGFGN